MKYQAIFNLVLFFLTIAALSQPARAEQEPKELITKGCIRLWEQIIGEPTPDGIKERLEKSCSCQADEVVKRNIPLMDIQEWYAAATETESPVAGSPNSLATINEAMKSVEQECDDKAMQQ